MKAYILGSAITLIASNTWAALYDLEGSGQFDAVNDLQDSTYEFSLQNAVIETNGVFEYRQSKTMITQVGTIYVVSDFVLDTINKTSTEVIVSCGDADGGWVGEHVCHPALEQIANQDQIITDISDTLASDGRGGFTWIKAGDIDTHYGPGYDYAEFHLIQISEVPVPAAAWLFGSALLGLAGFKRKHSYC
ncbi:VPLPA-CTERM sorting domain-containing protein [Oceanicoccus sagamiensis]|uniref:VPLPA-CTERM sorting domain-containing protein n=1 Tax=Oceanicoccus sagamiensis TaxID=716816 RepID=UPI000A26BF1D|nr:VPLPA-CTERM sorting domain-containing protein [Oceanicoccus sagamiensis]